MSESEDLKKNAQKSLANQRIEEINTYLSELVLEIKAHEKKYDRSQWIQILGWCIWVIFDFLPHPFDTYGVYFYIFAVIYNSYEFVLYRKKIGEFSGAVKVLIILGIMDDDEPRQREKKGFFEPFVDMVKSWAITKKTAQDEVFQPA